MFLSVSLSAAGAVDEGATAARRESAAANVQKMIDRFVADTGFRPTIQHAVAGALLYRQYGVLVRLMMRFISTIVGASTDTSRDHEYTDWSAVDRFAAEIAARALRKKKGPARGPSCPARITSYFAPLRDFGQELVGALVADRRS